MANVHLLMSLLLHLEIAWMLLLIVMMMHVAGPGRHAARRRLLQLQMLLLMVRLGDRLCRRRRGRGTHGNAIGLLQPRRLILL